MKKIIVAVVEGLNEGNRLHKKLLEYEQDGFYVEVYPIDPDCIDIGSLPTIMEHVREQYGQDISDVTLVSDVYELISSWFRIYNSTIDFFVYLPYSVLSQKKELSHEENTLEMIQCLSRFNGASTEKLVGRVYIDIDDESYMTVIGLLLKNNAFDFFISIDRYNFREKEPNIVFDKIYVFNGYEYRFDSENSNGSIRVDLQEIFSFKNFSMTQIDESPNIYAYTILFLLQSLKDIQGKSDFFTKLFVYVKECSYETREKIYLKVYDGIEKNNNSFQGKIFVLTLLVILKIEGSEKLLKELMLLLLNDKKHMTYLHNLLIQAIFYISQDGIKKYKEFDADKRIILKEIGEFYKDMIDLKEKVKAIRDTNHIVIITDQLLSLLHSPTKVALEYACKMTEMNPDLKITVFAEDNFIAVSEEKIAGYQYSSNNSVDLQQEHRDFIGDKNVEVIYSDTSKPKRSRVEYVVNEIVKINPRIVFTMSEYSISTQILYEHFPLMYLSFGTVVPGGPADLYIFKDEKEAIAANNELMTIPEHQIKQITGAISIPEPKRVILREEYGLSENDFVMVTVGNRLFSELTTEFIDMVLNYLYKNEHAIWLVVGPQKIDLSSNVLYRALLNRIVFVEYEPDLLALYKICDVFLNPIRHGGGYSVVIAMDAGLPVVISTIPSDGLVYVGEENACGSEMYEFDAELSRLNKNKDYRDYKGKAMKSRLELFTYEIVFKELRYFFEFSEESYLRRVSRK